MKLKFGRHMSKGQVLGFTCYQANIKVKLGRPQLNVAGVTFSPGFLYYTYINIFPAQHHNAGLFKF
jgi:hypothetical protein